MHSCHACQSSLSHAFTFVIFSPLRSFSSDGLFSFLRYTNIEILNYVLINQRTAWDIRLFPCYVKKGTKIREDSSTKIVVLSNKCLESICVSNVGWFKVRRGRSDATRLASLSNLADRWADWTAEVKAISCILALPHASVCTSHGIRIHFQSNPQNC